MDDKMIRFPKDNPFANESEAPDANNAPDNAADAPADNEVRFPVERAQQWKDIEKQEHLAKTEEQIIQSLSELHNPSIEEVLDALIPLDEGEEPDEETREWMEQMRALKAEDYSEEEDDEYAEEYAEEEEEDDDDDLTDMDAETYFTLFENTYKGIYDEERIAALLLPPKQEVPAPAAPAAEVKPISETKLKFVMREFMRAILTMSGDREVEVSPGRKLTVTERPMPAVKSDAPRPNLRLIDNDPPAASAPDEP